MSDEKSQETITSIEELPGGLLGQHQGESQDQVAQGLFDALGSDPASLGFEDLEAEEAEGEDDADADDHAGEDDDDLESDADDEEELEEGESEEDEEDEESDDGDDADDDYLELNDELEIEGVPVPGGGTETVSLGELKAGYSRQQDYTRKRQVAAEEHRQAMSQVGEIRSHLKGRLEQVKKILGDMAPPEPSEELRQENPGEYAAQLAERRAFFDSIETVDAAVNTVSKEEAEERFNQLVAYRNAEWAKVVERVPEWENNEVALPALAKLQQFAMQRYGFEEAEIGQLRDSRLFFLLKDVFDATTETEEVAEKVKKKRKKAKKRLKPGPSGTGKRRKKRTRKRKVREAVDKRARETGSVVDAAIGLELMLEEEEPDF